MGENNTTDKTDMRLLDIQEVCRRLGIGRWSVYKLINAKALKTVKIGARRLVSTKAVKDYIASLEEGT
jgi:excisionase family DNA binding protein